jgi:hypothetical protein
MVHLCWLCILGRHIKLCVHIASYLHNIAFVIGRDVLARLTLSPKL